MKFSFLAAWLCFSSILFAQIITPAYVISNGAKGVKSVVIEERSEFKDFRKSGTLFYNKRGLPISGTQISLQGITTTFTYSYEINEEDSTIVVTKYTAEQGGELSSEVYNYLYSKGNLWEWQPVDGSQTIVDYKCYKYDDSWNLIAMDELKVIGADTNIVKRHRYSVQTDIFHRVISTNHGQIDSQKEYYYDENGIWLSTAIFDGPVKRTTEHRVYNEDGLVELTMEVLNRGGNLMKVKRYSYDTYRKGKPSIFEKWMPVQHAESVMQER